MSRAHALSIWSAAVDAVRPAPLVKGAVMAEKWLLSAPRVIVVGAGKAGPGMAEGLETALAERLDYVEGLVNVPEGMTANLERIRLHAARPQGVNEPTAEGVAGAEEMLRLLQSAGPEDIAVCLLSGGGSALLPAPVEGVSLADKQTVTKLLHRCGATIDEMNCVRKHLSRIKGGRLAEAFRGKELVSFIVSDVVVGDPPDVIASGPTSPDPTTYADALAVLTRYGLQDSAPLAVLRHLEAGRDGKLPETPKSIPSNVENRDHRQQLLLFMRAKGSERRIARLPRPRSRFVCGRRHAAGRYRGCWDRAQHQGRSRAVRWPRVHFAGW